MLLQAILIFMYLSSDSSISISDQRSRGANAVRAIMRAIADPPGTGSALCIAACDRTYFAAMRG
jgi:hypothetical protein